MSVLVWDGEELACDSHANDGRTSFPVEKIWSVNGYLAGGVGLLSDVYSMRDWWMSGRPKDKFPKVSDRSNFVVVSKRHGLVRYTNSPIPTIHGANKIAVGSGCDFAYGALYMGANARQAVEAAIKYCPSCGGEVVSLRLE